MFLKCKPWLICFSFVNSLQGFKDQNKDGLFVASPNPSLFFHVTIFFIVSSNHTPSPRPPYSCQVVILPYMGLFLRHLCWILLLFSISLLFCLFYIFLLFSRSLFSVFSFFVEDLTPAYLMLEAYLSLFKGKTKTGRKILFFSSFVTW